MCDLNTILDMTGKKIQLGHIVAVRYVWNSYVGEITMCGLAATGAMKHAFRSPHKIEPQFTYQILGHVDPKHVDFNQEVFDWYRSEDEEYLCPVKVTVYDNWQPQPYQNPQ